MEKSKCTARLNIEDAIISMFASTSLAPYATVLSDMLIIDSEETKIQCSTIGVTINNRGVIVLLYNKSFINSITSTKELVFILIHEVLHIVLNHILRTTKNNNDVYISNIVQDAIINESILGSPELQKYTSKPLVNNASFNKDNNHSCVTMDTLYSILCSNVETRSNNIVDYTGPMVYEYLYDWFVEQLGDNVLHNCIINNFDKHLEEDFDTESNTVGKPSDAIESIVFDKVYSKIKSRGVLPSQIEDNLKEAEAREKNNDVLKIIRTAISNNLCSSDSTIHKVFTKPHLYGIEGLAGKIKKQYHINCILDTSGSMIEDISKVLGFLIKAFTSVTLIQIDTEIKSITNLKSTKKEDINKIKISGFGGTVLQPAIDYIASKPNLKSSGTLILTDGYTDNLNVTKLLGKVLVLSTGIRCEIKSRYYNQVTQKIISNDD